jgi:aminoglycoside phosphotransferase
MARRFSAGHLVAEWRGCRARLVPIAVEPHRSETWLDVDAQLIVKIYATDSGNAAEREAEALRVARGAGLPVPEVRREFEWRERPVLALGSLPGAPLAAIDHDLGAENRRAAWRAAGRFLATLHAVPTDNRMGARWCHGRPDGHAFLVARRPGRSAVCGFVRFDRAGLGDPADDLALAGVDAAASGYPFDVFVAGYRSIAPLDEELVSRTLRAVKRATDTLSPVLADRVHRAGDRGYFDEAFGLEARAPVRRAG